MRRSVRAAGFRENAFGKLLGERYRWMEGLGNKELGYGAALNRPEDVQQLLGLAIDLHQQKRRVLYFCACEFLLDGGKPYCHRGLITDELLQRARRQRLSLDVVEWPGTPLATAPEVWELPSKVVSAVARGRRSIVSDDLPLGRIASLAVAQPVWLVSGAHRVAVLVGPARFQGKQWVVPVLETMDGAPSDAALLARAREYRRLRGFETRRYDAGS